MSLEGLPHIPGKKECKMDAYNHMCAQKDLRRPYTCTMTDLWIWHKQVKVKAGLEIA